MVYVMSMAKEGFAMGTMLGIERIIIILAASMLFWNGLTMMQGWGVLGAIGTMLTLVGMLAAIAYYAGTGQEDLPDLRPFLKGFRQ